MCGIFGYIGKKNGVDVVLEGLKRLEYRGYDSAGIAGVQGKALFSMKKVGKVAELEQALAVKAIHLPMAIAHTRWATHGAPSVLNAHPQLDQSGELAVVHNGIIENYREIKEKLQKIGMEFTSETDTEVIAKLIGFHYSGDLLQAVQESVAELKGAYALGIVHAAHPSRIIAVAHECPLVIGIGDEEAFLSSDSNAFSEETKEVVFLSDAEVAVIGSDHLEVYNAAKEPISKASERFILSKETSSKEGYAHYTLKEIHEQPQAIRNALLSRYLDEYGTAILEEMDFDVNELLGIERILILACGTSWHAGLVASYLIEEMARIPVQVEISSEFRYKNPIVPPGTFVIAISQSGETADTLAAVRELKAKGAHVLGICNVYGSTLVREAHSTLFLRAGPEIGVCSTKAFSSQVVVLSLISLLLARMRHMSKATGQHFIAGLKELPEIVEEVLRQEEHIKNVAKKYAEYENYFFIGRNFLYPAALEGALKLKEISYINANGYPAGEMKHGPIALINPTCPTVALCANRLTYEKIVSNIREIKARQGLVIAIATPECQGIEEIADEVIYVPSVQDRLSVIPTSVACQLFAYYIALYRGAEIDQPRNLAKSVTVE